MRSRSVDQREGGRNKEWQSGVARYQRARHRWTKPLWVANLRGRGPATHHGSALTACAWCAIIEERDLKVCGPLEARKIEKSGTFSESCF